MVSLMVSRFRLDKRARFFVRTVTGECSTIILTDVDALNICGLRAGNIILELVLIAPDNLTLEQIEQAYDLKSGDVNMARQLLGKAKEQGLCPRQRSPLTVTQARFRTAATVPEMLLVIERSTVVNRFRQVSQRWRKCGSEIGLLHSLPLGRSPELILIALLLAERPCPTNAIFAETNCLPQSLSPMTLLAAPAAGSPSVSCLMWSCFT